MKNNKEYRRAKRIGKKSFNVNIDENLSAKLEAKLRSLGITKTDWFINMVSTELYKMSSGKIKARIELLKHVGSKETTVSFDWELPISMCSIDDPDKIKQISCYILNTVIELIAFENSNSPGIKYSLNGAEIVKPKTEIA